MSNADGTSKKLILPRVGKRTSFSLTRSATVDESVERDIQEVEDWMSKSSKSKAVLGATKPSPKKH
jgi:hypothetical protein